MTIEQKIIPGNFAGIIRAEGIFYDIYGSYKTRSTYPSQAGNNVVVFILSFYIISVGTSDTRSKIDLMRALNGRHTVDLSVINFCRLFFMTA